MQTSGNGKISLSRTTWANLVPEISFHHLPLSSAFSPLTWVPIVPIILHDQDLHASRQFWLRLGCKPWEKEEEKRSVHALFPFSQLSNKKQSYKMSCFNKLADLQSSCPHGSSTTSNCIHAYHYQMRIRFKVNKENKIPSPLSNSLWETTAPPKPKSRKLTPPTSSKCVVASSRM